MTNCWDPSATLTEEEADEALRLYRDMLDKQPVPQEGRCIEVGGVVYNRDNPMPPHMAEALLEMLNE